MIEAAREDPPAPNPPATPPSEAARLAALQRYEILDTPPEDPFDDLTQLAAQICDTPIALISLVDDKRQWFKSRVGLAVGETPRQISFCAHAIGGGSLFEVTDARLDPRFRDNPLVTGEPGIRFYAGCPLITADGHALGTLCVIDRRPRQLDEAQRMALLRLGRQAMRLIEERQRARQYAEQAVLQRVMFDNAANPLIRTSVGGRIEQVNAAAEHLLGHSERELLGQPLVDALLPPAVLAGRAAQLSQELGQPVAEDFSVLTAPLHHRLPAPPPWRLRHRDGHEVSVRLNLSVVPDRNGQPRGYLAILHDLTDHEQLQQRLQEIAAQVPGMLFQYRWHPTRASTFTYASEGIRDIYGLGPADIAGNMRPIFARVHEEDRQPMISRIRQATRACQPWRIEHRAWHPEKGLLWLEARAMPLPQSDGSVLWHGLVTDISARKAQQIELEKQQELNRLLIESLSEAVVACDDQGHLILFNERARQWLGDLPRERQAWTTRMSLFDSEGTRPLPAERMPLLRALRGERIRNAELSLLTDGDSLQLLVSADPLYASDGHQLGAVAVLHDITERKRIERLQREFVSTVSHELRTPLTSITGSLSLICNEVVGEIPPYLHDLLAVALENSQRLTALINDLLDIDKLTAGKMRIEPCRQPLAPLLEQSLRNNQGYAERFGVTFTLSVDGEPRVNIDALRLHQVLNNLLSNAVKFSPPGGVVRVSARQVDARVRVSVADSGPGVPEAFRHRIFQKFAQADASERHPRTGTGLGLAISKELIERMQGRIGFDSTPGHGACFWFELPLFRTGAGAA